MKHSLFLLRWKGGLFLYLSFLFMVFSFLGVAEAQHLHLGGSVDLSYSKLTTSQGNEKTKVETFQQRYNLRGFGDIVDPRLGSYSGNISFFEDTIKNSGVSEKNRFKIKDGSLAISLLPRRTPLHIHVQRITRDNKFTTSTQSTSTIYNLTWDIPLQRLPRLRLNLYQTDLESDETLGQSNTRNRAASLETDGRLGNTRVITRYQFSSTDIEDSGATSSHNFNLNVDTRFSEALSARGYGNYSTRRSSLGSAIPGVSFFRENSGGVSLLYRPSKLRSGNISYDYFQNPSESSNKFKRHVFSSSLNIRPNQKVDLFGSYRFLIFDSNRSRSDSHFVNIGVNYRPIFGLSTGISSAYGITNTSGTTNVDSIFQNYRYFIAYIKTLSRVRLDTSYNISYATNRTDPGGVTLTDLINSIGFGIENTNVRIVHGRFSYRFSDIRRSVEETSAEDDQQEHRFELSGDSNYFRSTLVRGDSLLLHGGATYSHISGFGIVGSTILLNTKATYYLWRGLILTTGYSLQDYPERFLDDRQTRFGEVQWLTYLLRNVNINLKVRDTFENNRFTRDRTLFEASSYLYWRIGRVLVTLEYRKTREERREVATDVDAFYVRASRPF